MTRCARSCFDARALAAINYARFARQRAGVGPMDAYNIILRWFAFWAQTCYAEFGEHNTMLIVHREAHHG